ILAAAAVFSDRTLFPGSAALLPVIGAVLVIAAGADALPNRRLLGVAPMRFIGRISYQIYLWHWPLLVIARARGLDAPGAIAAILAVTVILAW
ncbi:acyltransferase family protein, partial [Staphylococcus aureus]